jgi:3-(3-hydroxy-phenyl)propionate hydroxylase
VAHAHIPVWRHMGPTPAPRSAVDVATVVIVGAGPIGLAMALDLGRRGHRVVVVTRLDFIAAGSKAICYSKRTLEVLDRLGVGQRVVDKGVTWSVGKVFFGSGAVSVFQFDLLPIKDQKRPAFVNLQQYYLEEILVDALSALANVELRWGHDVVGVRQTERDVAISIESAMGRYELNAAWLIACDGPRSTVRTTLGLDFEGQDFEDNFLIADIKMGGDTAPERRFWFDPPFNPGRSFLMHRQPDNVWRLDFQLGPKVDREAAVRDEVVAPLIRAALGEDVRFTKEWYSVYTFHCRRMKRFVHGRAIFAGDSAHLVSPFGARGCNGGIADVDNLGWKLDLVLRGEAGEDLLESYNAEATVTADENILHSTGATDFIAPRSAMSRIVRDTILELSRKHAFARPFVNSGRLSTPAAFPQSPLNTSDGDRWMGGVAPGGPALDAPLSQGWLIDKLGGAFVLMTDAAVEPVPGMRLVQIPNGSGGDAVRRRYDMTPGAAYLFRPDQYVCARWKAVDAQFVGEALRRAKGFT